MFTLVVTAGLCKLSLWQWQRGMEKEAWLGRMAVAQQVEPLTLARIDWHNLESLDGLSLGGGGGMGVPSCLAAGQPGGGGRDWL